MKFRVRGLFVITCLLSLRSAMSAQIFSSSHYISGAIEQKKVADTVSQMFNSLQNDDVAIFDGVTYPNLVIFDAGAKFNRDSILNAIKSQHTAGHSISWTVTEPDVHISEDTAWIDYVNVGLLTGAGDTKTLTWLESAFLKKNHGEWKIEFLHSTLVPGKSLAPAGPQ